MSKVTKKDGFTFTHYSKGEKTKTAGIYFNAVAGKDLIVAGKYGLYVDLFERPTYYNCPNIVSVKPGSGILLQFLHELKAVLNKPILFSAITNEHLYKYLAHAGIDVIDWQGRQCKVEVPADILRKLDHKLKTHETVSLSTH